jgi:hypothetical protein
MLLSIMTSLVTHITELREVLRETERDTMECVHTTTEALCTLTEMIASFGLCDSAMVELHLITPPEPPLCVAVVAEIECQTRSFEQRVVPMEQ